jgi:redox-sensing transcriptional repressor
LPLNLHVLDKLQAEGREVFSASELSRMLGIYHTTGAQRPLHRRAQGRPRCVGLRVDDAIAQLKEYLGWDRVLNALVVGAGNLARALMGYREMSLTGIRIVALIDNDPAKIGTQMRGVPIYSPDDIPRLKAEFGIAVAIITTPAAQAQSVADQLVGNGIRTLWNFTLPVLHLPADVVVEHTHFFSNMAVVTYKHKNAKPHLMEETR